MGSSTFIDHSQLGSLSSMRPFNQMVASGSIISQLAGCQRRKVPPAYTDSDKRAQDSSSARKPNQYHYMHLAPSVG